MNLLTVVVLAQLAGPVQPALSFPEPGLDDTTAYRGYVTRFFRDVAGNTLQIYLDRREGRVVHLWADAENESIGFTARNSANQPVDLQWAGPGASNSRSGRTRVLEYELEAGAPVIRIGHALLGSMRVERDFQHWRWHRAPFDTTAFILAEAERFFAAARRLPPAVRQRHFAHLGAASESELRARLRASANIGRQGERWTARFVQPSIDMRDTIALELWTDARNATATRTGDVVTFRARSGGTVRFGVRVSTTGAPLTPLTRQEIFTDEYLRFADSVRRAPGDSAAIRARWTERNIRGMELLSSREKLMAGLPTYGTYFGRDMLVTALMMRPVWRAEMSEFVIGSVLRKLSPGGEVSHEEALGGQAVREAFDEYARLVDSHLSAAARGDRRGADTLLARATTVIRNARRVRENYHMIDDELQLPILVARWLDDSRVTPERKRAFLQGTSGGPNAETRAVQLLRELAVVARMTDTYARQPTAGNLISFAPRDSGRWAATSWRDSNAGYANGRFAMDVNAIWAPHALESLGRILAALRTLGISPESMSAQVPHLAANAPLGRYLRDPQALRAAADAWWGASRHFVVRLTPAEIRAQVEARLAAMPAAEREHWTGVLRATRADAEPFTFLAIALDAMARPIGVVNSDPATGLYLGSRPRSAVAPDSAERADVLRDVRAFVRRYPAGLLIDGIGPVVANDAYATPAVWSAFVRDAYHGPRVVWGREVNLFLAGVAVRIADAGGASASDSYVRELRDVARLVQEAAEGSGFQSELWSYDFVNGRPVPIRYGSGADIQLWSTTDLVVQWALSRIQ